MLDWPLRSPLVVSFGVPQCMVSMDVRFRTGIADATGAESVDRPKTNLIHFVVIKHARTSGHQSSQRLTKSTGRQN